MKTLPFKRYLLQIASRGFLGGFQIFNAQEKASETQLGVIYGLGAYFIWGFFPLFFKWVAHVPSLEVLSHRITWSFITLLIIIAVSGGWGKVRSAMGDPKTLAILGATTMLISTNWLVFIIAVDHGQVLQSSFGYFVNPLVSVLLGAVFLGERLRRLQIVSLCLATVGMLLLALSIGEVPWMSMILAVTFALYGLLRKVVPTDALTGLFVETLLLFPFASVYLVCLGLDGKGAFPSHHMLDNLLLPLAGVITAVPLLWFSAAARRLNLSTIGFMQYITPTNHFLLAVLAFGEPFTSSHFAGFACIWAGLLAYTFDAARRNTVRE